MIKVSYLTWGCEMFDVFMLRLVEVNGKWWELCQRVATPRTLAVGDRIKLGDSIREEIVVLHEYLIMDEYKCNGIKITQMVFMHPERGYEGDIEKLFPAWMDNSEEASSEKAANWPDP